MYSATQYPDQRSRSAPEERQQRSPQPLQTKPQLQTETRIETKLQVQIPPQIQPKSQAQQLSPKPQFQPPKPLEQPRPVSLNQALREGPVNFRGRRMDERKERPKVEVNTNDLRKALEEAMGGNEQS